MVPWTLSAIPTKNIDGYRPSAPMKPLVSPYNDHQCITWSPDWTIGAPCFGDWRLDPAPQRWAPATWWKRALRCNLLSSMSLDTSRFFFFDLTVNSKKIDMQFTTFPLGLYFSVFSRLLQWLFGSFHFNVSFISSCVMFFSRVFRRLKSNVPRFQVRGFLASSLDKLTIIPLTSWRREVKADTIYSDWILRLF